MIHPDVEAAFETIDAAMFSGDTFFTDKGRAMLREYLGRWNRWDVSHPYYAADGTLLNADGSRSIFDDVDK